MLWIAGPPVPPFVRVFESSKLKQTDKVPFSTFHLKCPDQPFTLSISENTFTDAVTSHASERKKPKVPPVESAPIFQRKRSPGWDIERGELSEDDDEI
jgi:hypothetical protein